MTEQSFNNSTLKSVHFPARDVSVIETCDVCVIGGSCTGVFAAVRAAEMGAKVVLVEKQNTFGGVATSGLVNLWHKLESNDGSRQIIAGLTGLILDRLKRIGAAGPSPYGFTLNSQELKIELDRLVVDTGVIPAEIEGRRHIRAIMDIARKYGGEQKTPHLAALPSYIGIRETRSFTADYVLTKVGAMII